MDKIISLSEPVQHLADGFGGPLGPAEGLVWWKEDRYLLFSDIHNNRRVKYEPGAGVGALMASLSSRKEAKAIRKGHS